MKSFQLVTLFALFAAAMAFAPNQAPKGESTTKRRTLLDPGIDLFVNLMDRNGRRKGRTKNDRRDVLS
jgi:hypothetical protein